jgi:probable F420-dependent oxidoreductase
MSIPFDLPLHQQRDLYVEMADNGYTDFWSAESNGADGFTPLALAAAWVPDVRLGVAIIPVYTRGPATLAMCAASLAEAAPGRFVLGIGCSSNVIVEQWNDVPFERPWYRVRDTLRFLRSALAGNKVDHEYDTFKVRGFRLARPVPQPPTILVAALREGMLRLAGREGDGAILNWLSPDDVRTVAAVVHAQGEGREIAARIFVIPSTDRDKVRAIGRRAIAAYLNVPVYAAFHEWLGRGEMLAGMWQHWRAGDRKAALEAIPDDLIDQLIVHGTPGACRERVAEYVEAGIHTPALQLMDYGDSDDLRTILRELSPAAA